MSDDNASISQYFSARKGEDNDPETLVIRTIAMAADTNPAGDIFGGWLMSQMDLAAGNMAARVALGRVTTVAVEGMQFHRPVNVGDEVTIYAKVLKIGRTSVRLHLAAWARANFIENAELVTESDFICVALDEEGRPRPVRMN